jgi:hypothetical protein
MQEPRVPDRADRDPVSLLSLLDRMSVDMSEVDREGDEMSGDEHSSGMQGGESEERNHAHIQSGLPGEETEDDALIEADLEKHRLDR